MFGQLDQLACRYSVFFIGLVRMGANRAINVRKPLRDLQQLAKPFHPGRDGDDATDARAFRTSDDRIEIFGEVREIEMTVAIDQHGLATAQSAFGST